MRTDRFLLIALSALCIASPCAFAQTAPDSSDDLIKRNLGDRKPEDVYDFIRKQTEERNREAEETRKLREEVQATLDKMEVQLFDLELFIAKLKDGVAMVDCTQVAAIDLRIASLQAMQAGFTERCATIPAGATESAAICERQVTKIGDEMKTINARRSALLSQCGTSKEQNNVQ